MPAHVRHQVYHVQLFLTEHVPPGGELFPFDRLKRLTPEHSV